MNRRRIRRIVAALALLGLVLAAWAFWLEPNSLRVVEYPVALKRWPASLNGLRVAVISDLHAGAPFINKAKIARVVARTNAAAPDLVLLTGDIFVNGVIGGHPIPFEATAAQLNRLQARLGVYLVYGNHEHFIDMKALAGLLATTSIHLMDNKVQRIENGAAPFWLLGLADFYSDHPDITGTLAQVTDEAPIIAFTHSPDVFPLLPARINLLVAGHTHGGQILLPIVGRGRTPSAYGRRRFAAGHVVEQTDLFVSTGIGTSHVPIRFRVPPEISLLTLTGVDQE
jgi:uncharacterized protein